MYDYVVVGAGFAGAVVAERIASQLNKNVLIVEKRPHIGGNSWSEVDEETGILVHKYGSHIFHTSNLRVWNYIQKFTSFNKYKHSVRTEHRGKTYPMPINLETINSFYSVNLKPQEAAEFLRHECPNNQCREPQNFEQCAISLTGLPLYEAFIREYTIKQWGKNPSDLPASMIKRLPIKYSYNCRYFSDPYEGIPSEGYHNLFRRILNHPKITVNVNTDWFDIRSEVQGKIPTVYTGPLDVFFDCSFGRLEWRCVHFQREVHTLPDYQGIAVMNFADIDVPWTRIHEFKHFNPEKKYNGKTVIYKEFAGPAGACSEPSYPVNTPRNRRILMKYLAKARSLKNVWFCGRLGLYKYLDMDKAIEMALDLFHECIAR
jgi:UDP-galactopyranose mutase